jgi:hypothetical protein
MLRKFNQNIERLRTVVIFMQAARMLALLEALQAAPSEDAGEAEAAPWMRERAALASC